jgi:hypothetical protein
MKKILLTLSLVAAVTTVSQAGQTIRELWDNLGAGGPLDGKGSDVSTVGLQSNVNWTNNPPGSTAILYKDSFTVDWPFGGLEFNGILLPSTAGGSGCLFVGAGNLNSLIDPNTSFPYGTYTSQAYATRPLTTNAYINFQANGTYFFSVRIVKSYSFNVGDNSTGMGFASGTGTNAHFVSAGFTRPAPFLAEDGITDIGDTAFISTGTLGQAGVPSHPDDSGGPYYPRTNGPAGLVSGDPTAGLLVGRLTTTTSGASTMDVKVYHPNDALDTDPNSIVWDATYNFTETNVMTDLLVFMHGTGGSDYDAIRVGTTYGDAIGLELVGAPSGSPGNTVYAGTTVTLSQIARLNTGPFPMAFQWRSNSVDILDATNATLVLTNTTTSFTADYSVAVSNFYGMLTSAVTHVTILPAVKPFFTAQPASTARYLGSPTATFTVGVDGTPPMSFQWKHAGTNIPAPAGTNQTLVFGPVTLADAGQYFVTVTNQFGSTNSAVATNTVIMPAPGSYAAAVLTEVPYGYWILDETNLVFHDYYSGHDGVALDPTNTTFGVNGAAYYGFAPDHKAVYIPDNGHFSRVNLPALPGYSNAMTFTCWINSPGSAANGLIFNRDPNSGGGYGDAYGLEFFDGAGQLGFHWQSLDQASGLFVPLNQWTFVALVIEPGQATIYMGPDPFTLSSTVLSGLTLNSATDGAPLVVGRNPWPWAEGDPNNAWANANARFSDLAVFYSSLTPDQIRKLYLAGVGLQIQGVQDGAGNLVLTWLSGVLQEADKVTGPYNDILSATPPYPVPLNAPSKFYRVKLP